MIFKGAVETQVRGYMLTSGTMPSAQVAEVLCAAMPKALRDATEHGALRAAGGGAGGGRSGGSVWSRGTDSSSTCYWVGGMCGIAAAGYWWPAYSTERPVGRLFHSSCCTSGSVLFILCRLGAACLCLFSL